MDYVELSPPTDHERVLLCQDKRSGLHAIVAIHNTRLGPAMGGCRRWCYPNESDALLDVLNLSQGMTYKNALAGLPIGGGKSVILSHLPGVAISEGQLAAFGEFVETLKGAYIAAEDVGMGVPDLKKIAEHTRFVTGVNPVAAGGFGGDPSPNTALGVLKGIKMAVRFKLGRSDLGGLSVAVQGLGHVGYHLCKLLFAEGVKLTVTDIDAERMNAVRESFNAKLVAPEEILFQKTDVISPCAMGGVLHETVVTRLKCSIVAGAANNQLKSKTVGALLASRNILYAPDYVINAGGIISASYEYMQGTEASWVSAKINNISTQLEKIFTLAECSGRPTNIVADELAMEIIRAS